MSHELSFHSPSIQAPDTPGSSDSGRRHLALVFFDVLVVDSVSYLSKPYSERRRVLEQIINVIPGHSMLAQRTCISVGGPQHTLDAERALRRIVATHIADYEEGVVLKADNSLYRDWQLPWIKARPNYTSVLIGAHAGIVD